MSDQENRELKNQQLEQELKDKIEQIKATQEKIADLEGKLVAQRTVNIKTQKDLEDRCQALEIQLTQTKEKLNQVQMDYQASQMKKIEEKLVPLDNIGETQNIDQVSSKNLELQNKLAELEHNYETERINLQLANEKLAQFNDVDLKIRQFENKIGEMEAEIQQKIRQIESMKDNLSHYNELEQKFKEITEKYNEKEIQIHETLHNKSDLDQKIKTLENAKATLITNLAEITEQKNQIQTQADQVKVLIKQKDQLQSHVEELKQTESLLNAKIKKQMQIIADFEKQMDRSKADLTSSQQLITEMQAASVHREDRIKVLENELNKLREDYVRVRNDLSQKIQGQDIISPELNQQLTIRENEIAELKHQVENLNSTLAEMTSKNQLDALNNVIQEKDRELESKEAIIQSRNKELEDIRGGTDSIQQTLQEKIVLLQKDVLQIPKLQLELTEKVEKIKNLETQLGDLQQLSPEIEKYKNELNEATEHIKEYTQQKEVLYELVRNLKAEMAGDKAIIDRLESRIKSMEGKGVRENLEADLLKKKVIDLENELRTQLMKSTEAQVRYETIKPSYDRLTLEVAELQKESEQLKTNFDQTKRDLEAQLQNSQESQKLKEDATHLQNDINELKRTNDSLVDETTHLKTDNLNLRKEKQTADDEIVNLKRRIKLIRRNVTGDIRVSENVKKN